MEAILKEIEAAIPEAKWRSAPEHGLTVFHGDAGDWRLLVVSQSDLDKRMGTATHLKQLLIVKLTDQLTELAYARAKAALS
jgi:hypothetical protein